MEQNESIIPFEANSELQVVDLVSELTRLGLIAPKIPAKELAGREFVIRYAKQFMSSYDKDRHCYFVKGEDPATGEVFTTVLGGQAIVDVIDLLVSAGFDNPLLVKLEYVKQGSHDGYYQFAATDGTVNEEPPF